ncbi:hypothetical protein IJ182_05960 [bacterium]|nr:hypothetical protein [bacterium]
MKKILTIIGLICLMVSSIVLAADYDAMYDGAELFPSKLYNDIDPFEDEDAIKYAYSPYPLFRTSAFMYFKDYTIEPGYYSVVPRKLKDKYYVLFKQGGKVQFIIPIAKKEPTPVHFYEANTPKVHQTKVQKITGAVRNKFYNISKSSMKIDPPKSMINIDVEVKYIIMTLYYGEDKFTLLFRRTPY